MLIQQMGNIDNYSLFNLFSKYAKHDYCWTLIIHSFLEVLRILWVNIQFFTTKYVGKKGVKAYLVLKTILVS